MADDDDTQPNVPQPSSRCCTVCKARADVDAAVVRSGADRVTLVTTYVRPPLGTCAIERTRVIITIAGMNLFGDGQSREDALDDALRRSGVNV